MKQELADITAAYSPQSLRIGLFSESFQPVQNGVTTSVLTLISGLRTQGHRVWVFAPEHLQKREREFNVMRFPSFVSMFNREYPLAYPFIPRIALTTHFKRLRLDIVHTHTPFVLGLTGANLAIRRDIPLVSTFHTLYTQYSHYLPFLPETVTESMIEHYLEWYYNRCAEIICPSKVAADALASLGITTPIEIIPTGIPLPDKDMVGEKARIAMRAELSLSSDTPVLLYAGRLAKEKNIIFLLEALKSLLQQMPSAILLVAGGGPYAQECESIAASLEISGNIRFLGPTPRIKMDGLYAAADVFCFPSPSETQGLVIGEARAAGVPCVVVDAGGAPEHVADGIDGFRIAAGNRDAFVMRLFQILTNQHLRDFMRANALINARLYTPEVMIDRVADVYMRAGKSSPPINDEQNSEMDWESIGESIYENSNR